MKARAVRDINTMDTLKTCKRCGFDRRKTSFYKASNNKDGLQAYCKTCCAITHNEWKEKHPERYKAYFVEYARLNGCKPRLTKEQRSELYAEHLKGIPVKDLAHKYNICISTAYLIISKKDLGIDNS